MSFLVQTSHAAAVPIYVDNVLIIMSLQQADTRCDSVHRGLHNSAVVKVALTDAYAMNAKQAFQMH